MSKVLLISEVSKSETPPIKQVQSWPRIFLQSVTVAVLKHKVNYLGIKYLLSFRGGLSFADTRYKTADD